MKLPQTIFAFIWFFVKQQKYKFITLLFVSVAWAVNDTIFPYFLKKIIDSIQNFQGDRTQIFGVVSNTLILLMSFWVVFEILQRISGIIQIYMFPQFRASIRRTVFDYVRQHSYDFFTGQMAGGITKKIADLPSSCEAIVEIVCFQFLTAGVGSAIVITMLWKTKPIFALIVGVWLIVHLSLTSAYLKYGNALWIKHSESVATLSGKIVDIFSNILNVRLFAHDKFELDYLKIYQNEEIERAHKTMWAMELARIALGLNGLFLIFGTILSLLYGWVHYWVTVGDFTQISMQVFWLLGWIWFISFQVTVLAREMGTVGNGLTIIQRRHDLVDIPNARPILITRGEIHFDHVSFAYRKNKEVFNDLNLFIPGGQKVGLVGFSGSGKSTLVNLLLRFYDVQAGRILIDEQNIAHVTQNSLRAQIAMIPQDPTLFNRTMMENIRYGRLNATDEEVIEASKLAHCHEFIEKLPGGYQSLVGERGLRLSGGQRQRIAIARAILKNAPILILDEATSALDSVTERLIQESLQTLMQGKTTLVVAHRLSTLSGMDRIVVFDKGKIVEEGSQEALLENENGAFSRLWNMQMDGYLAGEDGWYDEEAEGEWED